MKFGTWVRGHRLRQGLSMDKVCKTVDMSKAYLSLIETGQKGPPKDDVVRQLAIAINLDEEDLLMRAHQERFPDDVLRLRGVIGEMRGAVRSIQTQAALSSSSGASESSLDKAIQALNKTTQRLQDMIPSDTAETSELLSELEDLRAEEREFILNMANEIKRLRPRRGPQKKKKTGDG